MISTRLLATVPPNNRTAFSDYAGILAFYHQALAEQIQRTTGVAVRLFPLGNGRGEPTWLDALTRQHRDEAVALGIAAPPDFTEFDVSDPAEFASLTWTVAQDLERLRLAAGLQ